MKIKLPALALLVTLVGVAFAQTSGEAAFQRLDKNNEGKLKSDAPQQQLYNLATDPSQTKNVIHEHPAVATRLAKKLEAIRSAK